jgi:hypothetical protein
VYIPQPYSGAWSMLIALRTEELSSHTDGCKLLKSDITRLAEPLCSSSFYTVWRRWEFFLLNTEDPLVCVERGGKVCNVPSKTVVLLCMIESLSLSSCEVQQATLSRVCFSISHDSYSHPCTLGMHLSSLSSLSFLSSGRKRSHRVQVILHRLE